MKTDSLFYRLFKNWPQLALDFLNLPYSGDNYCFVSEEIKQTGFRIDGLFKPNEQNPGYPLIFAEAQSQADKHFYGRLFTEITLYLYQEKIQRPWLALVIYPKRNIEKHAGIAFEPFMQLPQLHRVYLEDYQQRANLNPTQALIALIACKPSEAVALVQTLVNHYPKPNDPALNFIETVLVYKLPNLSREEIRAMLGLDTQLKQTRFYQEIAEEERREGRQEGVQQGMQQGMQQGQYQECLTLLTRQLRRKFGQQPQLDAALQHLTELPLAHLEDLADALLDFTAIDELHEWLQKS